MKQERIYSITAATGMARSILAGITEVGAGVTLSHSPAPDITTDLNNLLTARGNHDQGKETRTIRRQTLVATIEDTQKFVRGTRDLFKMRWGNVHFERFAAIGFRDGFEVTDSIDDLQDLLQAIKSYFTANPAQEVTGLFTALQAQTLMDAIDAAKNAVTMQEGELANLMAIRDAKFELLRRRISDVYQELLLQLDPLDARWLKFGFKKPGADETPDKVTGVTAALIGPTAVAVKWELAARATYYRVFKKVVGVDDDFVAVGSPGDLDFTIENLPSNKTIEIMVTANNNGGESPVSETISIVTQ